MKKKNGDARTLGTSKAVLAIAVSLYAAMAGAQTSPAEPVAQSASSTKLTGCAGIADRLPAIRHARLQAG